MTLESKINESLRFHNIRLSRWDRLRNLRIEEWWWNGIPFSHSDAFPSDLKAAKMVEKIIMDASLVECLTSPSAYIREYRKWYELYTYNKGMT